MRTNTEVSVPGKVVGLVERGQRSASLLLNLKEHNDAKAAAMLLRQAREIIEGAEDLNKEDLLSSLDGKAEPVLGGIIEIGSRRQWGYEDAVLDQLEAEKKVVEEKIKRRQKLLQSLDAEHADASTGEIVRPAKLLSEGRYPKVVLPK